jgi:MFS family permease
MIKGFGVPDNDVAYWAGITSAVFSFAQSLTAVPWGRASDNIGRKPTIIIGLFSTMICFLIWGIVDSLPMAIFVRAIQGGGNGNGEHPRPLICPSTFLAIFKDGD